MPARIRPEGAPDNRLALLDHAFFSWQRATGEKVAIQLVWVYEHPLDFEALRRFHHNLGYGLLGRRVERSPVPFFRHRWVLDRGPSDIDFAERARPRAEVSDWADERAQVPTDPELGPGWHLGVQHFTDGSTAVSLVVSHYLVDGLGLSVAVIEALLGHTRDLGLPPPGSRTRLRAVLHDARDTARDAREIGRTVGAGLRMAPRYWRNRAPSRASSAELPGGDGHNERGADEEVVVPAITIHVDLNDWDARAKALGGTRNTLVAAVAVKLADRIGRRRASDGAVTLQLPISERTEGDTRANAMAIARASIDPTHVTKDLRDVRTAVKDALSTLRDTPDPARQFLWLAPFRAGWAMRRAADAALADPDRPVFCSNLGDHGSILFRLDGTEAEYGTARAVWHHTTRQWLERTGGLMRLQAWRTRGTTGITVLAYEPGAINTKAALRELAADTLADFELTGDID
ncbi:hypothetical protein AU197_06510 [Mycobacterium sp. IS-1590]|uniref:hypothetical protein n=1 Tax=Mycobacterium sp. IS-1590 TaxID=1772286 RepID=UPI000747CD83|nr:hypothetical protein [Mycobacterium sp. IS-1590]KUI42154.1 hypothetical protein AU197_06510 [Mycobacterium sp. IS-1590]